MLPKLFFAIAGLAVIGAALLALHQHRLTVSHAMADLHVAMDRDRKATWDAQADIAEGTHPVALREAVQRVGLELEPLPSADDFADPIANWSPPDLREHEEDATVAPPAEPQP